MRVDLPKLSSRPFCPSVADCRTWSYIVNQMLFEGKVLPWRAIRLAHLRVFAKCETWDTKRGQKRCMLHMRRKYENFGAFLAILIHEMVHYHEYLELGKIAHGTFFVSKRRLIEQFGIQLNKTY